MHFGILSQLCYFQLQGVEVDGVCGIVDIHIETCFSQIACVFDTNDSGIDDHNKGEEKVAWRHARVPTDQILVPKRGSICRSAYDSALYDRSRKHLGSVSDYPNENAYESFATACRLPLSYSILHHRCSGLHC
ncbi:hypothetical protein CB0940_11459 [Cercospora beticola]|uniref:Uncharacterized protein n=1 Tax=Cercospora beticola TaxID=122368 RepID=A0A2G5HEN8_CERBT|nr:hypothetical protein CB0940_11459 [Cercospora beticola]PIA91007.1 hypothetical protein CB0940_11459 [Cercospora beticola]CAK1367799.1 unnamed protein product [Cercospora beticola]